MMMTIYDDDHHRVIMIIEYVIESSPKLTIKKKPWLISLIDSPYIIIIMILAADLRG